MTVLSAVQSLVQTVLAALGPSQHQRLLRLHTPLGPNVLLAERMQGIETIGPCASGNAAAGFKFEVLALSTNAHLQLKDLIGQPVRLDLLTQQSATELRPFHGHVTGFALLGSDGGLARYKLTIEPWLSFLSHREDAWVFQDKTVMQIVDEVFADYQGQGQLAPAWRWELADAAVYPQRSLCIQYHESDLAFVQRLLAEEGLFCWFEHSADEGDTLGQHTLVIADHNGCFQPNAQPLVRYTQSAAASFKEDSLTRFDETRRIAPTELSTASWDHSSVQQASAQAAGDARLTASDMPLTLRDQPGAYAYEDATQAQRIAQRQLEAIQAPAYQCRGQGAWRQAACATTFSVGEHPSVSPGTRWVTLAVQHRGRNNITADLGTSLQALLGNVPAAFATQPAQAGETTPERAPKRAPKPSLFKGDASPSLVNASDEPLYQANLIAQDANIPVRAAGCVNERGDIVFDRPQVSGAQTAIVVGLSEPVHTDRDGRIKVQFHWQRGDASAHRLGHSAGSNAPGDDSTGTWVRVSQAWAGDNWGGHHTPRLGQEVLVSFVEGDIDRPVVTGGVYNGQGQADAQGNQVAGGAATATGNAGPWFAGNAKAGEHEGHQHLQVLAGFKSQSLDSSQSGIGGYNQLVLDDSPAQSRMTLGSTTDATWLQLGHLQYQNDNQRLAKRGHGLDLASTAHGALRAGSGLLLTGYAKQRGTESGALAVDVRPEMSQLQQADELVKTLVQTAQQHHAKFDAEPAADKLPCRTGLASSQCSLELTDSASAAAAEVEPEAQAEAQAQLDRQELQVQFMDVESEPPVPMANVSYCLTLADGAPYEGVTDGDGKTKRIVTSSGKPLSVIWLEFFDKPEGHAKPRPTDRRGWWHLLKTARPDLATSNKDLGNSLITYPVKRLARPLTPGEIDMATSIFGGAIDYSLVRIHLGVATWFDVSKKEVLASTNENVIYYSKDNYSADLSKGSSNDDKVTFIHEMVHVWQHQLGYAESLEYEQHAKELWDGGGYEYDESCGCYPAYELNLEQPKPLWEYNHEQQGQLISHYYGCVELGDSKYEQEYLPLKKILKDFLADPFNQNLMPRTSGLGE